MKRKQLALHHGNWFAARGRTSRVRFTALRNRGDVAARLLTLVRHARSPVAMLQICTVVASLLFPIVKLHAQGVESGAIGVDTDGDGYMDEVELQNGYSPWHGEKKRLRDIDSDNDGLWDDWEIALGTDRLNPDTDADGYKDGEEVLNSYDPRRAGGEKLEKRIEVTLDGQRLAYFFGETKLDEFLISSGKPKTPTPKGEFTVLQKKPVVWYAGPGYNYPNTKWNLMFKRGNGLNYYIHGAYWHNDFGKVRSAGCVNVPYEYAYMGRLYDWAQVGTRVIIR